MRNKRQGKPAATTDLHVPVSACEEVVWPALPAPRLAQMIALLYQFEQSQWWSPETLEHHQLRQLEVLCAYASRNVPYYRERLKCVAGLRQGDLTRERWREIPILRRADIQESGSDLVSRRLPKAHLPVGEISTSGSTGRSITAKTTSMTRLFFHALNMRYHLWHERDFAGKTCAIMVWGSSRARKPNGWAHGYRSGPMVHFDISRPVAEQISWLMRESPAYLLTYPNNLKALLRYGEETGSRVPTLHEVVTMAEVLDPETRTECERVWGVSVVDSYSSQEAGMIALQCPKRPVYHVQSESVMVEILREDATSCRPGEVGRVVVTDLKNLAMPLIRYEIGDYAEPGEACPCGRGLPVLARVLGRSRNMLRLPSGEAVWPRLGIVRLAKVAPVRQAQMVQTSLEEIRVNLVVARPLTAAEEDGVCDLIGGTIGSEFVLRLAYVDEIPRAASGKFEDFRSELEP